jgi:hypothetical protein
MSMKPTRFAAKGLMSLGIAAALSGCNSGGGSDFFAFSTLPPASFVRVDRTGQPAVGTALLSRACPTDPAPPVAPCTSPGITIVDGGGVPINLGNAANPFNDQRDQLNRGDPINDARDFAVPFTVGPQANSLRNIHFEVGPQLRALGLVPCSTETVVPPANNTQVNIDTCVAQVAPVVLPDVVTFNFSAPAGWPNGRHFDDPVADRILAAALLNLSTPGQTINSLVGVINTWNGPAGQGCVAPCAFTGDETGAPSPNTFPYLRPAQP